MAEYRLLIKASAAKEIEAIGTKAGRQRVVERIQTLATDPRTQGSEKLAGYAHRCRIRQGQYRIIYFVDDGRHEVTVFKVGHRKDVYRQAIQPGSRMGLPEIQQLEDCYGVLDGKRAIL